MTVGLHSVAHPNLFLFLGSWFHYHLLSCSEQKPCSHPWFCKSTSCSFLPQELCTCYSLWKVLSPDCLVSLISFSSAQYQRPFLPITFKIEPSPPPIFYPHHSALFFFVELLLFYVCIYCLIVFHLPLENLFYEIRALFLFTVYELYM